MSGKYPNGGYRTKSAVELSMPRQATPPTVTASAASQSGNSQVRTSKYPKLSEMLGNGSSNRGTTVRVDLRDWADRNAGKLTPGQRDRLNKGNYGSGTHSITIDLKGSDYRVNGRGALMRAVLRAARKFVGVGKRLPRNLWKDLFLELLSQVLGELERSMDLAFPEQMMQIHNGAGGRLWSYDPRLATFAGGVLTIPKGSMTTGNGETYYPGLGEVVVDTGSALPTRSTSNQAAWAASGYKPFMLQHNNISSQRWSLRNGSILSEITRGVSVGAPLPGVQNSHQIGLYVLYRNMGSLQVTFRNGWNTYPAHKPRVGGEGGGSDPYEPDNPKKERDKKFTHPIIGGALSLAYAATELGDTIDCIYAAMSRRYQYGRDYEDKIRRIYDGFDTIDWGKALSCMAVNQVTDPIYGRFFEAIDRGVGNATVSGFWAPGQITYGSGPGALELSF